jgi:spermidine synthase
LLVDAFDKTGVAPALASREFFETCFEKLSAKGQLVINLAGDKRRFRGLIDDVSDVFNSRVIVVPVRGDGNAILFAFKPTRFAPNWRRLHEEAKALQKQFGLDFPDFVSKMEKAHGSRR